MESTTANPTKQEQLQKYIDSLSPKEKKAYEIAVAHLGSSFSLEKSLGFTKYINK